MRAYIAGPLFTLGERSFCRRVKEVVAKTGIEPVWPWDVTDQHELNGHKSGNQFIFDANLEELDNCDIGIAVLDGPDVDSGTAWEIGYLFSQKKPVIGIRTDFRKAGENEKAFVNLMINESAHTIVTSLDELEIALGRLKEHLSFEKAESLEDYIEPVVHKLTARGV